MTTRKKNKMLILFLVFSLWINGWNWEDTMIAAKNRAEISEEEPSGEAETETPAVTATSETTSAPTAVPEEPVYSAVPTVPAAVSSSVPTAPPAVTSTAVPTQPAKTAAPTPVSRVKKGKYVLKNSGAKYKKGGQKGISYHKIKGKKIYHIKSYTTDTVQLRMSQSSVFRIYGGGSKKEVKKKTVTVSSKGLVKCHEKGEGKKIYTIVKAVSKKTKEVQYIYICFQKKLTCKIGNKMTLLENYTGKLKFDYRFSKIKLSVKNKKKAKVNKKGVVRALKHGTTYVTAKVKGSKNNQIRIKIIVQKEPWIVSNKDTCYDYDDMTADLRNLAKKYPGKTKLYSIGESYDDRRIWCLRIGSGSASRKLVINSSIHAREWLNTQIIMRQSEEMLREYREYRNRFRNTCIYILPMCNPDGVSIAQHGFDSIRNKKLQKLCRKIGHADIWKANARGVNLNNNFPVGFPTRAKKPDYMNYTGKKAASEKETKALIKFYNEVEPKAVINLHSMGNVLYWDFNVDGELYERQHEFALKIHSFNQYTMMPKSGSTDAAGGMGDWLVYKKKTPSVTVETGSVPCPLPHSQYNTIYKKNNKMFRWFMTEY